MTDSAYEANLRLAAINIANEGTEAKIILKGYHYLIKGRVNNQLSQGPLLHLEFEKGWIVIRYSEIAALGSYSPW